MKRFFNQIRRLGILLLLLLSTGQGAQARAENPLPDKIQGIWALPDCGQSDEALILTHHFYLKSNGHDMTLLPVSLDKTEADYWILDISEQKIPVRREADGILKIGVHDGDDYPKNWDDLTRDQTQEYTNCVDPPALVPKTMIRMMLYIDRLREHCTISLANECARALFKMADANADQKLTPSEIKRVTAGALLLAGLADQGTLTDAESDAIIGLTKTEGQKISDDLFARYDRNGSKDLDYNELMEDFTPPALPVVKDTLAKIGNLIPAFKLAALGVPTIAPAPPFSTGR